ncbi:MAG TPA: pseudaminic acid synthase [Vicinamibacterales bacterium]|nr:pseudaminic acid synthase [Vicinamibacterales bacterium]
MTLIRIGERAIGAGAPVYIVAEMSANHGHSLDRALELVRAAKDAGADAIKLQTYTADTMTIACDAPHFRVEGTIWNGRQLHDLYAEASTPWDWHRPIAELALSLGLQWFSTPFDATSVDFLEALDAPAYKVASFELVDVPLLKKIAATGKPVILSTGMATRDEIAEAVTTLRDAGCTELVLLKCTSAYPATADEMDLRTIPDLAATFGTVVGLSDHSMDAAIPAVAVALGACVIEKHFTLSRTDPGPDSSFSLEPRDFADMVAAVRTCERALGRVRYEPTGRERTSLAFRRSIFVVADIKAGERLTPANVRCIRPGHGLHPRHFEDVLGRVAAADIPRGTPLSWDLIA